jgi:hypothetical protein
MKDVHAQMNLKQYSQNCQSIAFGRGIVIGRYQKFKRGIDAQLQRRRFGNIRVDAVA